MPMAKRDDEIFPSQLLPFASQSSCLHPPNKFDFIRNSRGSSKLTHECEIRTVSVDFIFLGKKEVFDVSMERNFLVLKPNVSSVEPRPRRHQIHSRQMQPLNQTLFRCAVASL